MASHDAHSSDNEKNPRGVVVDGEWEHPELAQMTDEERVSFERKLIRKLDWKLIPWLTLLYLVSFLDRTNIGNAKVQGLVNPPTANPAGLDMSDGQYRASLSIFFVSYALFEPLTNILLKVWRPKWFLTVTMTLWGIVMVTMGLCHNFDGLATARFFLGVAEAGLFPGINYYLSCWYKRSEFGIRAAIFFSAAALAGSFGGLLAAAIGLMNGIGGKPGWAWIFIIEGLVTVLIGLACFWMVHDFPDEARFLNDKEREVITRRLRADKQASAEHEKFQMKYLWSALADWKTYAFSIVYMGCDGALYAFSLFTPTIIAALGYSGTTANLLSVPPYAAAAILTVTVGFLADRYKYRGVWNMLCGPLAMAGFAMLLGSANAGVQYAGVFLGALGIYPCVANTIAWASNNTEGVFKRGVVLGIVIGWGNLNGVVSSNIYRAQDKPRYYIGHGVVLAYMTLFLFVGSILTELGLMWENKRRAAGKLDYLVEGKSQQEIADLGDKRPDFYYTL